MPSVRKVKRQFCCSGAACVDPLVRYSSKCTQQPLVKYAGAITPAESESVNATEPSCCFLLPFHRRCRYTSNLSILHDKWHAKGKAADAAGTERFSYTWTTKALFCPSLSWGAATSPSLTLLHHVTLSLTSFTTSSVSCPDPSPLLPFLPLHYLLLKWGHKRCCLSPFHFLLCASHKQEILGLSITPVVAFKEHGDKRWLTVNQIWCERLIPSNKIINGKKRWWT